MNDWYFTVWYHDEPHGFVARGKNLPAAVDHVRFYLAGYAVGVTPDDWTYLEVASAPQFADLHYREI